MDFKDKIKQLGDRVENLKDNLQTEEATKMALIIPFISALGYDVFNPLEVLPEMNCDITEWRTYNTNRMQTLTTK